MAVQQIKPPSVPQKLKDSCWAACLQSWSRADIRLGWLDQMDLVGEYAQTPTGGITPGEVYPKLGSRFGLESDGFRGEAIWGLLQRKLPTTHVMVGFYRGQNQWHALLVYKIGDDDLIYFMDPDGGRMRSAKEKFFNDSGPHAVMWRK